MITRGHTLLTLLRLLNIHVYTNRLSKTVVKTGFSLLLFLTSSFLYFVIIVITFEHKHTTAQVGPE